MSPPDQPLFRQQAEIDLRKFGGLRSVSRHRQAPFAMGGNGPEGADGPYHARRVHRTKRGITPVILTKVRVHCRYVEPISHRSAHGSYRSLG